jgi:preprotein translocase subunit SecA
MTAPSFTTPIDTLIPKLEPDDYEIDEKQRSATFTEAGTEKLEGCSPKPIC